MKNNNDILGVVLYRKERKMLEPKIGPIPVSMRLPISPDYGDEEKAICRFVNGDTNLDQFFQEVDAAYRQK